MPPQSNAAAASGMAALSELMATLQLSPLKQELRHPQVVIDSSAAGSHMAALNVLMATMQISQSQQEAQQLQESPVGHHKSLKTDVVISPDSIKEFGVGKNSLLSLSLEQQVTEIVLHSSVLY